MERRLPTLLYLAFNATALLVVYGLHLKGLATSADPVLTWAAWTLTGSWLLTLILLIPALGVWLPTPLALIMPSVILVAALIDSRLYAMMGVHLYSPVVTDSFGNPNTNREFQLGWRSFASFGGFLIALALLEWAVYRGARAMAKRLAGVAAGRIWFGLSVGCATMGLVSVTAGARDFSTTEHTFIAAVPGAGMFLDVPSFDPGQVGVNYPVVKAQGAMVRLPDIVFLQVESLRSDMLTPELMPRVSEFLKSGHCASSDRHYSGGNTTEYGTFTLLYGLSSIHYDPFLRAETPSWPLQLLKLNSYQVMGASASSLENWNGAAFMTRQLDPYHEFLDAPAWSGDRAVIDFAKGEFAKRRGDPRFLFLFLNATHHNYHYPPEFERHTPVMAPDYDHFMGDERLSKHRLELKNRYLNAVGYVDATAGELLDVLKPRMEDGDAILVFTGDHGEEFWEHGLLGHAATRFINERNQVPLLLCGLPEKAPIPLSTHADVWPTVLRALGFGMTPTAWSTGRDLMRSQPAPFLIGGRDFPWGNSTAVVVDPDGKQWVELAPGEGLNLRIMRTTTLDDTLTQRREGDLSSIRAMMSRFLSFHDALAR